MKTGIIDKTIEEYNRYRNPEIIAELLKSKPLTIKFSGIFCRSCAPNEYFEDFRLMLEENIGKKIGKSFYIKKIYNKKDNYEVIFDETKGV